MCRYENPRGPNRRHLGVRIGQDGGAALFVEQAPDGTVVVCAHANPTDGANAEVLPGAVVEFTLSAERWHAALGQLLEASRIKKQVWPKKPKKAKQ